MCRALGLLFLAASAALATAHDSPIICYFPSWAKTRGDPYTFRASDVPTEYCSHVVWSFATINNKRVWAATPEEKADLDGLLALKQKRPGLKVMASLGGATAHDDFDEVVSSQEDIDAFAGDCLKYVQDNGLDGIDVDWEFPSENQTLQFTQLLTAIRSKLDSVDDADYLLSVAMAANRDIIEESYDIPQISELADIFNIMAYDYYSHLNGFTELNSRLHYMSPDWPYYSTSWVVKRYEELGLNMTKATLGIPFYGRSWTLASLNYTGIQANSIGAGEKGPASDEEGVLFYYEVCDMLSSMEYTTEYDEVGRGPYAVKDNQWISYDNVESVKEKVKFLKDHGMAGAMVWDISQDDFKDWCDNGSFPLARAIAEELHAVYHEESTTTTTTTTTESPVNAGLGRHCQSFDTIAALVTVTLMALLRLV